ncbi:13468_t:CDS:1, partial [Acaulospora morrowiae]
MDENKRLFQCAITEYELNNIPIVKLKNWKRIGKGLEKKHLVTCIGVILTEIQEWWQQKKYLLAMKHLLSPSLT